MQQPETISREILRQLKEVSPRPDLEWTPFNRKTSTRRHLDPARAALIASTRLIDCGTFPRGRVTLEYQDGTKKQLGAHQCRHRACPICGKRRGSKLYSEMAPAIDRIQGWGFDWSRVRFMTLTLPNSESAWSGIEALSAAWHRFLANRRVSRLLAGGFRCFEVKPGKDGRWNIHLHAICWTWAQGAPYAVLRQAWDKASGAPAGSTYNQQFDELRKKAKPKPGETKASAAARYLVKYLGKWEDMNGSDRAPGGLPHLMASLEGRRMFGDWGIGKASRRIQKHESPAWLGTMQRHMDGYRSKDGALPIKAEMDGPGWKGSIQIPVPPLPAAISEDDFPEQMEKAPGRIRAVRTGRPLDQYAWRSIPTQGKDLGRWMNWEETRRTARARIKDESPSIRAFRATWRQWREEHAQFERKPKAFRWGSFVSNAPKTWTKEAESVLGQRYIGSLGASLWTKVRPLDEDAHIPASDERHWSNQLISAVKHARKSVVKRLSNACISERAGIISELPEHIARYYRENEPNGRTNDDSRREIRLFDAD